MNFSGIIEDLKNQKFDSHDLKSMNKSNQVGSISAVSSVFQLIYHLINLNQIFLVSDKLHKNLNVSFSSDNCDAPVPDTSSTYYNHDNKEWYDHVNINAIWIKGYFEPMSTDNKVYNEIETFDIPDDATV